MTPVRSPKPVKPKKIGKRNSNANKLGAKKTIKAAITDEVVITKRFVLPEQTQRMMILITTCCFFLSPVEKKKKRKGFTGRRIMMSKRVKHSRIYGPIKEQKGWGESVCMWLGVGVGVGVSTTELSADWCRPKRWVTGEKEKEVVVGQVLLGATGKWGEWRLVNKNSYVRMCLFECVHVHRRRSHTPLKKESPLFMKCQSDLG